MFRPSFPSLLQWESTEWTRRETAPLFDLWPAPPLLRPLFSLFQPPLIPSVVPIVEHRRVQSSRSSDDRESVWRAERAASSARQLPSAAEELGQLRRGAVAARADADKQRRMRIQMERQLKVYEKRDAAKQQQVTALQQQLRQMEQRALQAESRAAAATTPSSLQRHSGQTSRSTTAAHMQARIDELQARNEQLERAVGQSPRSSSALSTECCACRSAAPSVLYRPCLHLCMCALCDQQMTHNRCPLCRAAIRARLQQVRLA